MIATKNNIQELIPQRAPFVMIDSLLSASDTLLESEFMVNADNIFLENGILQEPALIENIAQTCAAGFGYRGSQKGGKPGLGFIGGISKLIVHELPALNAKIDTRVEVTYKLENIYVVKGESSSMGRKLIECEMKIVEANG